MLTLANIYSLNWFTARSKEHYQLTLETLTKKLLLEETHSTQ